MKRYYRSTTGHSARILKSDMTNKYVARRYNALGCFDSQIFSTYENAEQWLYSLGFTN